MYWSRSFVGDARCLADLRWFTASVLGGTDRPGVDLVVLAASELAGNAILHTASGEPDGLFVIHLAAFVDRWQVRIDDAGSPHPPRLGGPGGREVAEIETTAPEIVDQDPEDIDGLAESGRGLALVA